MRVCYNGLPIEEGAWTRRPGFVSLGFSHRGLSGVIKSFEMEDIGNQNALALLEFTSNNIASFLRVWVASGTGPPEMLTIGGEIEIVSFSAANPSVMTVTPAQTWNTNDTILITITNPSANPINGANLHGRQFVLTKISTTTFNIADTVTGVKLSGADISYTASSGTAALIVVFTGPYTALSEVRNLRALQSSDNAVVLSRFFTPWLFTLTAANVASFVAGDFKEADGPYLDPLPGTSQTLNKTAVATTADGITYHITIGSDGPSYAFVAGDVGRCFRIWTQPAAFDIGTTYALGAHVTYQGNFWTSNKAANIGVLPGSTVTVAGVPTMPWDLTPGLGKWTSTYISAFTDADEIDVHISFNETTAPLVRLAIDIWQIGLYTANQYPQCGAWHDGRLVLLGAVPNRFDLSRAGAFDRFVARTDTLFSPSNAIGTVLDDSAIAEIYNARDQDLGLWAATDRLGLIFGTANGEWLVQPSTVSAALTPTDIGTRQVSRFKSAFVEPARVGSALLFAQSFGRKVYEFIVDAFSNRFAGRLLNQFAEHLPDSQGGIREFAFQEDPVPVLWACCNDALVPTPNYTSDSTLLGCTYRRISEFSNAPPEFNGWHAHQHAAGRGFQSIAMCTVRGQETLAAMTFSSEGSRVEVMTPIVKSPTTT